MPLPPRSELQCVTFDCWATLIHEAGIARGNGRGRILAEFCGRTEQEAGAALSAAFREHQIAWHRQRVFDGADMTRHALAALGVSTDAARFEELLTALEEEILSHDVRAIAGARELLVALRDAGVRRALICDTGFTPGRMVRRLLDRVGLLELLEVTIFSDEVRVPKPHPKAFSEALRGVGVSAQHACHVGDLRRSDIAGARSAGMYAIRFSGWHDDRDTHDGGKANVIDCSTASCNPPCERPEADAVVSTYPQLAALLELPRTR